MHIKQKLRQTKDKIKPKWEKNLVIKKEEKTIQIIEWKL